MKKLPKEKGATILSRWLFQNNMTAIDFAIGKTLRKT